MRRLFPKLTRRVHETGTVYQAVKVGPPKKLKNYDAEFVFRDEVGLLQLKTRPGVFSHREVDAGARALLLAMYIEPGVRVLDIGCGSGVIALAAAARGARQVHAVDSNARAVQCLTASAETNHLTQIRVAHDCDGHTIERGAFDVAIANPPYFANYRIAGRFVRMAAVGLRSQGQLIIVTKTPQWYVDELPELGFGYVDVEVAKNYLVVHAIRD